MAGGDLLDVADGAGGHERGGLRGRVDAPRDGGHVRQDEHLHHLGPELLQINQWVKLILTNIKLRNLEFKLYALWASTIAD